MKEIIDFYASDDQNHWLSEINKSDWRAGKYLYELLLDQKLKELCGESTKALLLFEGDKLISFCTYAEQMQDQKQFRATYDKAVVEELAFRGLELEKEKVLKDTIRACISIISRGEYDKEDYTVNRRLSCGRKA